MAQLDAYKAPAVTAAGDGQREMRKRIWPTVMSFFMPGAGHLAIGAPIRGSVIILSLEALGWLAAAACAFDQPWLACGLILIGVLSRIPICIDTRQRDAERARPKLWVFIVAVAAAVALSESSRSLRQAFLGESYEIPGDSMAPTLLA